MADGFSDEQFKALKNLMKISFKEVLEEEQVVTRKDIKHLPTKEEFYESQDKLMTELKKSREEQPVQAHQISNLEDRVTKIEKHLRLSA